MELFKKILAIIFNETMIEMGINNEWNISYLEIISFRYKIYSRDNKFVKLVVYYGKKII